MIGRTTDEIDAVTLPGGARIAMIPCPGIGDTADADIAALAGWGAEGLVSLVETAELEVLGVADMDARARAAGLWWRHLPIRDMCAPDDRFERAWCVEGARLRARLRDGASVALHCWAGLGRTGTIAARLVVELGAAPDDAIRAVRAARRGAIQSLNQELHVHRCRPIE